MEPVCILIGVLIIQNDTCGKTHQTVYIPQKRKKKCEHKLSVSAAFTEMTLNPLYFINTQKLMSQFPGWVLRITGQVYILHVRGLMS